jgi:Heparinase II/III-like protein
MKKKCLSIYLLIVVIFLTTVSHAQSFELVSLPGGSEGVNSDISRIDIGAQGIVMSGVKDNTADWSIYNSNTITSSGALGRSFNVLLKGMTKTNTTQGINYGKVTQLGSLDRDSEGRIGILGGDGNGIDKNEGLTLGLDLSNISPTASIKINRIRVANAINSGERGVIVNRINPSKQIIFGLGAPYGISTEVSYINISQLNVYLTGGEKNDDLLTIFNSSTTANNFRIIGIEFQIVTNIFNTANLDKTNFPHPRLLLNKAGLNELKTKVNLPNWLLKPTHQRIIEKADTFVENPTTFVLPEGRLNELASTAIEEIFYLSYAYRMTNNSDYLDRAKTILNTICGFSTWRSYSLDTCEMSFAAAIGYDWLYNELDPETRKNIRTSIVNKGFINQEKAAFWNFTSNWNQVCLGSLAFSALAIFGDQDAASGETTTDTEAKKVINRILVSNPNSMNTYGDGNYPEGPMYWNYGTTYEVIMLSALESIYGPNHEGINRLVNSPGFLESVEYTRYVTGPTSKFFNYNDSTEKRFPLPAAIWMAKKANKPNWLSEEKKLILNDTYLSGSGIKRHLPLALIYGKDIDFNNSQDPTSKLWNGYGPQPVVLVRTAWTGTDGKYLGVKGGTPEHSHAHMDGGTFVYDSKGQRWGMDFGKFDYAAYPGFNTNDQSQTSKRWDVFKISNLSHNTISIKKTTSSLWQKHNVNGFASIDQINDSDASRGTKVNLQSVLNLDNDLRACTRNINIKNNSYLEINDYFETGSQPINVYWNMVTNATVTIVAGAMNLSQNGEHVKLSVSATPNNGFTLQTARNTQISSYNPVIADADANPNTRMVGYTATIPANTKITFTVTIKDIASSTARLSPDTIAAKEAQKQIESLPFDEENVVVYAEDGVLFAKSDSSKINDIRVFDVNGRLIVEQKNLKSKNAVVNNLQKNQIFIVQITSDDNQILTKKIMIADIN